MSKTVFTGPLRKKINEYMEFKKSLGFTMRNTAYVYAEFDRYLAGDHSRVNVITREMVIKYLSTTIRLHSTSRAYRVTLLRGFCRYLYQKDPRNYIPEPKLLPAGKHRVKPHIYSPTEIARIIKTLQQMQCRKMLTATNVTGVALLATTGIRIGELCRLNLEDVDLKDGVLSIKRSKFFKSRMVPISRSTAKALLRYKLKRLGHFRTTDPKAPFFVGMTGNRVIENGVSGTFRGVLRTLGIKTQMGTRPRLHDLRHTFATRCLERVYRSGKDPEAHLPMLATYMGHVNLDYTQTYLHPSLKLLRVAGNRFHAYSASQTTRSLQ